MNHYASYAPTAQHVIILFTREFMGWYLLGTGFNPSQQPGHQAA